MLYMQCERPWRASCRAVIRQQLVSHNLSSLCTNHALQLTTIGLGRYSLMQSCRHEPSRGGEAHLAWCFLWRSLCSPIRVWWLLCALSRSLQDHKTAV